MSVVARARYVVPIRQVGDVLVLPNQQTPPPFVPQLYFDHQEDTYQSPSKIQNNPSPLPSKKKIGMCPHPAHAQSLSTSQGLATRRCTRRCKC